MMRFQGFLIQDKEGDITMVGKTLKSKINGDKFFIVNVFTEAGKKYYTIRHLASGKTTIHDKEWFERGIMQNLEVIE